MASGVQILNLAVVRPFVGHIECGRNRTTVRIGAIRCEQLRIVLFVNIVDGIVKCEEHNLGCLRGCQIA